MSPPGQELGYKSHRERPHPRLYPSPRCCQAPRGGYISPGWVPCRDLQGGEGTDELRSLPPLFPYAPTSCAEDWAGRGRFQALRRRARGSWLYSGRPRPGRPQPSKGAVQRQWGAQSTSTMRARGSSVLPAPRFLWAPLLWPGDGPSCSLGHELEAPTWRLGHSLPVVSLWLAGASWVWGVVAHEGHNGFHHLQKGRGCGGWEVGQAQSKMKTTWNPHSTMTQTLMPVTAEP